MDFTAAPSPDWRNRLAVPMLRFARPVAWLGAGVGAVFATYLALFDSGMHNDPVMLKVLNIPFTGAAMAYFFWAGFFAAPAGWALSGHMTAGLREYSNKHSGAAIFWFGAFGFIVLVLWLRVAVPMITAMLYGPLGGGLRERARYKRVVHPPPQI